MSEQEQPQEIPIQPVDDPIICSPYYEPTAHWLYDTTTGEASKILTRRPAGYWYKTERTGSQQLNLEFFQEEERDDLPIINALRSDVKRWREANYRNATKITRQLLKHWSSKDRFRRLFFCQLEAAETVIYLIEIRRGGKRLGFTPQFSDEQLKTLVDQPADLSFPDLFRLGCKMATGSGKTVVMAMLIAWAFCNRAQVRSDERFPSSALVVCPNLTIKERLQVLRPERPDNYYDQFEMLPNKLRPMLNSGKVLVTNWHQFAPQSEHHEGGESYQVVNKGPETEEVFAKRVLGELYDCGPVMVLNDEAHHAYRPNPEASGEQVDAEGKKAREEATVWVTGLDKLNKGRGINFCVDLSATPFYIKGSGYAEGTPFPWLVSDFGLVDAIESGITKIPRLPVSDTTGRPEPKYFRLWQWINERVQPAERLPGRGRKPKPEVVYREAEDALNTLASQWKERFEYIEQGSDKKQKLPNSIIIVCDNTDIAEYFFQKISGEDEVEVVEAPGRSKAKRAKTQTAYGQGQVFPELLSNTESRQRTLRIDSKMIAEAESENKNKRQASEELRQLVSTVGKVGQPGEQIRCVVSVAMLTEGWDANNVTHILGLRAFTSQLLCEQVVGRGLRRMDYTFDPETEMLSPEYVDVYGIPFSVIPFKGRATNKPAPEDKPKNHVKSLPQRGEMEIRFPVVEGYAFALRQNEITAEIEAMDPLVLEPDTTTPTAVYVKPASGYQAGTPGTGGPGAFEEQDRDAYYQSTHIQAIKFEMARQIVWRLVGDSRTQPNPNSNPELRFQSRHRLFPQVFALVDAYIQQKVDLRGCNPCELGQEIYSQRIVERLQTAIQPNQSRGELPLLPILNRHKPIGTSAEVNFTTIRPCMETNKSQVDQVVLDSQYWEGSAVTTLENSPLVDYYVRNDHLGLMIPYEYLERNHNYEPDFLVRLTDGSTLILEIKGRVDNQDHAKHDTARRWVEAANNWQQLGRWKFDVCYDPPTLSSLLESNLDS